MFFQHNLSLITQATSFHSTFFFTFDSFRELAASRPLPKLRTAEELEAAARAKGEFKNQEIEGEIHPNDGFTEAK